jgi:hypothetical protein
MEASLKVDSSKLLLALLCCHVVVAKCMWTVRRCFRVLRGSVVVQLELFHFVDQRQCTTLPFPSESRSIPLPANRKLFQPTLPNTFSSSTSTPDESISHNGSPLDEAVKQELGHAAGMVTDSRACLESTFLLTRS